MTQLMASPLNPQAAHLVLPNERIARHTVTLPPTPAHRVQAALAGALEEQLLDDPIDLHFALAPDAAVAMKTGRPFEVMVCNKAWLKGLLDKAVSQGQTITAIVPESAASQAAGWNLAQFEFRPQPLWTTQAQVIAVKVWRAPEWRLARMAVLVLVLVHIIGLNVWAWRDRASLQAEQGQIASMLTQTFPETQVVVDASAQMEKALIKLRTASGALAEQGLEAQLARKATVGKPLSAVDFANNELKTNELKVGAP
jgi:general secretion pathway protein L